MSAAEVAAFAPVVAAPEDAVLAPLVEPPELFCLRVTVRDFSSVAHGLAEPGIGPPFVHTCKNRRKNVLIKKISPKEMCHCNDDFTPLHGLQVFDKSPISTEHCYY